MRTVQAYRYLVVCVICLSSCSGDFLDAYTTYTLLTATPKDEADIDTSRMLEPCRETIEDFKWRHQKVEPSRYAQKAMQAFVAVCASGE